ncbi:MAG: hypothetical protein JW808_11320, partial [Victivallales bacterium]|nr:hypothetical protein [Victivallales bacterium]
CRDLGYTEQFEGANKVPNGNGVLNPAGIHFLERFAEAMAAGNMTIISDGSHGYDQQQPQHLQPFLAEYRSLPAIGMTPLEHDADPVAAWQGTGDDGRMYFYLANRLDQTVDIRLRFEGDASPIRLSTKEVVKIDGGVLKLTIKPYQFLSFEGGPASVKITGLRATVSESIRSTLLGQITFSESLAFGEMPEPTLLKLSPVEIKKVKDRLVEAKMALEKGRVVSARRMLLSYDMTKLYEAFHAYPPGLLYKKNPHPPKGAMIPHTLRDSTIPASFPTRVLDASKLAPSLSGVGALDWEGSSILIGAIEQFSNRYRLELAYVAGDSFSAPSISIDGKAIPESAMVKEETETCGRVIGLAPLSLIAGAHKIEISKATGSDAAILFLSLEPVPRDLVASDWLVIGPFAGSDDPRVKGSLEEMMDKKYQPETSKDFTAQCEGLNGRKLAWQHPQFSSDYVDLYKLTGEHKCRISYAACHIFSPTERDAQIKFGVDYWAKIWVNGEEVFNNVDQHKQPPHKDEYAIPVKLQGGDNEIMVKIHAGIQGNGFWMSVSDPGDLNLNLLIE